MIIYIDKNYKCHTQPAEGLRAFDVPFFDGRCKPFVEGYRYVPPGETWQREDGELFRGEMISPCADCGPIYAVQNFFESISPEITELREKLLAVRDCLDGLATNPGLEQLLDFIHSIRELLDDD